MHGGLKVMTDNYEVDKAMTILYIARHLLVYGLSRLV